MPVRGENSTGNGSRNGNSAHSLHPNGYTEEKHIHILEIVGNAIMGGMERHVLNLVQHLPADRFGVTCLSPFESPFTSHLREMGCDVFTGPVQDDPPWRTIQMAVEIIRHRHVDLVHAHMPKAHILAGLAGCLTQTPAVATVHGMNMTTQELGISRTTGSYLITVCQEAFTQAWAMGVPSERVSLIPNGVDTDVFVPDRSGDPFRAAHGIPVDIPLIGFVGRLDWEKGPDLFVRAAEVVSRRRPEVHFVMVGTGAWHEQTVNLIQQTGLQERVHLVGHRDQMWEVYPAFDIVAQTSRSEGLPYALLEAMACGRPIVAMPVGGVLELVEVGTTGVLSGQHDWEGVGLRLLDLLSRPDQMRRMGQAARRRAEERFSLRESVRQTAELFQRLANSEAGNRAILRSNWPAVAKAR